MSRIRIIATLVCVLVAGTVGLAQAQSDDNARRTRVEAGGFYYDFSEGGDQYGPWWGGRFKATNSPAPGTLGFTGLFEVVAETHDDAGNETNGFYFVGGGLYDLNADFYTYTSFGVGTDEPFAQFTVHQELNYKLPPSREVVIGFGGGFVDYHDVNQASYMSAGSAYYWSDSFNANGAAVIQYQYRRYFADPVDKDLNTHILSFGFGWQADSWTRLQYVSGQDFFRAGGGAGGTFDADLDGQVFRVEHEQLIKPGFGVVAAFDFTKKSRAVDDATLFSGPGFELRFFWDL